MAATAPPPVSFSPARRLRDDLRMHRATRARLPPGLDDVDLRRTRRFVVDPLAVLLPAAARFGPVFTVRILATPVVFALGAEATHAVLVSEADAFRWRDGSMGDLIPFLGDGLLTIDGAYHRQARRIMLPAFHSERIAAARGVMEEEADRGVSAWRAGEVIDLERWARTVALRVALRALFGLDPERSARGVDLAAEFERGLAFYGRDYLLQMLRGPGTPWARMRAARRRIDTMLLAEIRRRRARPSAARQDVLSLLLQATAEDGETLSDDEVRDQVMTLLFAGHDTTTATLCFLFFALARHPEEADPARLPQLIDETLRLYPPAWVGPRRVVRDVEVGGHAIPAGVHLSYCSYASHRLPAVWPDPEAFRPDRFAPEAKAALPKGAYVPFGGGSRACLGIRFGLLEVEVLARRILAELRLELRPGFTLEIRQTPTLGPRDGLPMTVRAPG